METNAAKLRLFGQSTFPSPVPTSLVTGCPVTNLSATADDGSVLFVRRDNGELVSKHVERGQTVQVVRWKSDGQSVAVGWSDGIVRLTGLENSKALHHVHVCAGEAAPFVYIAWTRNSTSRRPARGKGRRHYDRQLWNGILEGNTVDDGRREPFLDLPHELTFLEVDTALPKLSPLPISGGSGDDMFVFSTRTSLEFVFQPSKPEDSNMVDVMIVGTDDGAIHLSIYDTFIIGTFPNPVQPALAVGRVQLCGHASHPNISTHALLLQAAGESPQSVYLVPMDLYFIPYSPINLSLLASKITTLQKLLRYIKQTQIHITGEWQSTRELPNRFLMGLQEDLKKSSQGPTDVVQTLYHTAVTGHMYPVVNEWLVDSLAERGHKRWDKAVVSGLENLRGLVHENMLPALERCAIILSRLNGLAKFHEPKGDPIGFSSTQITHLMDIVTCLTLVSHKILLLIMQELELFVSFSSWLRLEIDNAASPSVDEEEELTEEEATMDNTKVMAYIRRYLIDSPLAVYLGKAAQEDYNQAWEHCDDGVLILDVLDKELKKQEAGQAFMRALPQIGFLVAYFSKCASVILSDIAETQKRCVRFDSPPTKMDIGEKISKNDVRMCAVKNPDGALNAAAFTVLYSETRPCEVFIFRSYIEMVNGISKARSTTVCGLSLGGGRIIDLGFLSDDILLVLWRPDDDGTPTLLLRVPFRASELAYVEVQPGGGRQEQALRQLSRGDVTGALFSPLELPDAASFRPLQMEVMAASGARGYIPARVCLLGDDRVTYKVFALPDGDV